MLYILDDTSLNFYLSAIRRHSYKRNKYKVSDSAKRTVDGIVFASRLESRVYTYLKTVIGKENFSLQPKYELQPKFRLNKKAVRAIHYVADFLVVDGDNEIVVDAKGMTTPLFKIKEKMFKYRYNKEIVLLKNKKDMRAFALSLEHIKLKIKLEDL